MGTIDRRTRRATGTDAATVLRVTAMALEQEARGKVPTYAATLLATAAAKRAAAALLDPTTR